MEIEWSTEAERTHPAFTVTTEEILFTAKTPELPFGARLLIKATLRTAGAEGISGRFWVGYGTSPEDAIADALRTWSRDR